MEQQAGLFYYYHYQGSLPLVAAFDCCLQIKNIHSLFMPDDNMLLVYFEVYYHVPNTGRQQTLRYEVRPTLQDIARFHGSLSFYITELSKRFGLRLTSARMEFDASLMTRYRRHVLTAAAKVPNQEFQKLLKIAFLADFSITHIKGLRLCFLLTAGLLTVF